MNLVVIFTLIFIVQDVYGHGRLRTPASRASMWREGFDNPPDYSDNQGFCGGATVSSISSLHFATVFENHRKSLIQHCERSELRLHFAWTEVH